MAALRKLTPNLMTDDLPATIRFYRDVLGFSVYTEVPDQLDPSVPQFAIVGREDVTIMLQNRRTLTADAPALAGAPIAASVTLFIDVEDAAALWAALAGKVEVVTPLHDTWYHTREVYFKDNNGYVLCYAQSLTPPDAAPSA